MPRVLLTGFCAVPGPRRAGVQLRQVIRALTPMCSVDLLVVREGDQAYVERQGSVRVLRVPSHEADQRAQIQSFQRALKRQLDGADYDVVHCRDSWAGIPVLEARARLGYAVVYDLTRSPLGETTADAELDAEYARDEDTCLAGADLVLAPTPAAVKALLAKARVGQARPGPRKPERVVLSPPGVDVDRFDWDDPPTGGPPRILYVGSIDPGRGVRVLVKAMSAIVREVDARLVIAGSMAPKFDQPLQGAIRELGLTDKVEVLGPIDHDQIPALIASATVCVVPAAADLTPSPTVVFPTKILEYMACKRAIVAPRRETLANVVENNREALLFEAGDPVDLARKVLRLLGEPMLRERLAQHAYERVRREFTASATRRALKAAYTMLGDRFSAAAIDGKDDEAPKVELLADDDFEATVFEEVPAPPAALDTHLHKLRPLEEALQSLGDHERAATAAHDGTGSESGAMAPAREDETMERAPVIARPGDSSVWQLAPLAAPPGGQDDWVVTNVAQAVRVIGIDGDTGDTGGTGDDAEDLDAELLIEDGTPIEGVVAAAPPLPVVETTFVAGEIDVPAPRLRDREDNTPAVEFTAASAILGPLEPDPDTGSRTPPLERR
ncbi:MAG TPA: glycosyltransferase family 4 protein [Kofleriaceae bacterium]|nr:glycosyltransferase family 4 protein [Kofleriaceae bacterium]